MRWTHAVIFAAFAAIVCVPLLMRPAASKVAESGDVERLIVVTPHIQQIRYEFGRAFAAWHRRVHGTDVAIDWRTPGGTTDILKQLEAQYGSALRKGDYAVDRDAKGNAIVRMKPGTIGFDVMFGGGSYDHSRLKRGVEFSIPSNGGAAQKVGVPMSEPAGFPKTTLDEWLGVDARVGRQPLYDEQQYWIGTALSSFGIVFNRDVLRVHGLREPETFKDLCDPRYAGLVALSDPRQSGSVNTTFESILDAYGWEEGWRILRSMSANTKYFTNSAPKPPQDVSSGDAAAGLAIDFYGRGQAESVGGDRVGYTDPKGTVYVDADPVSILRGAPHPDLARRFVEFCLSEEAQAIWQYPARGSAPSKGAESEWGPERYELHRLPIRRSMYTPGRMAHFVDKVDPFVIAGNMPSRGWRGAIAPMMGCFAIDIADDQRAAWASLNRVRASEGFPEEKRREMEALFFSWPTTPVGAHDVEVAFTPENFSMIMETWKDPDRLARLRIRYTSFFRSNYRMMVDIEHGKEHE